MRTLLAKSLSLATALSLALACACSSDSDSPSPSGGGGGTKPDPTPEVVTKDVTVYTTTASKSSAMASEEIAFDKTTSSGGIRFTSDRYQTIDGFGMAITQAACYNLLRMSAEDRTKFLKEIFSVSEGLGSSLIRVCIGGSDFSLDEFTWCDKEGIENFDVQESDKKYLFPILDEIYAINPGVKIIASPWSAPRWMKRELSSNEPFYSWTSGRLDPKYYADYATYFVKWIQEMKSRKYNIYAITIQNEPLNKGNSMSMYMPWSEQRDFIKQALGPAFKTAGLDTKILLFDHNYNYDNLSDQKDYPMRILEDADAAQYVAGSAWHNYGGNVSTLDGVYAKYPDKDIFFTEASIGKWNHGSFSDNFVADFKSAFIGPLVRGSKGSVVWNLMLDKDGKPYRPCGCETCFGAVTVNSDYKYTTLVRNTHYYFVAQCSKVVKAGAVRLGTSGSIPSGITLVAFQNPDKSYAVVVLNESTSPAYLTVGSSAHTISRNFAASSITSLTWKE